MYMYMQSLVCKLFRFAVGHYLFEFLHKTYETHYVLKPNLIRLAFDKKTEPKEH